ncbi:hypothetical protein D1007_30576 [Hordeum vulgare]|nr:hypothetical protein D1007_30576 [Hordeum vulgare]
MPPVPAGSWKGSMTNDGHIEYLRRTRKLPSEEVVEARAPGDERVLQPRNSERVILSTYFLAGFGLRTSSFLRHFLQSYGLQMHHPRVNSVLYIACFVTLCEAYLGILPFPSFFRHFSFFRSQMHGPVDDSYSGAMIYRWSGLPLPMMKLKESFNK